MTDQAISPLRRRMIGSLPPAKAGDMTIRKLAPKTQHDCVQRVKPGATCRQLGVAATLPWFPNTLDVRCARANTMPDSSKQEAPSDIEARLRALEVGLEELERRVSFAILSPDGARLGEIFAAFKAHPVRTLVRFLVAVAVVIAMALALLFWMFKKA